MYVASFRIFKKFTVSKLIYARMSTASDYLKEKTGLVLGVYTADNAEYLKLTPTAQKFNEKSNGILLDNIKLPSWSDL
ncbi:hypothetical protein L798_09863 [Zootermopsis nevadensis]|uniref:Uncharacterized protein n=1 Tax=Zootermopsis nevadensis TaxID=136037 RepID=A0A067QZR8_ZOONE|nr:hypothetical protein L798_09863 [Zootermopsis nevadensis]